MKSLNLVTVSLTVSLALMADFSLAAATPKKPKLKRYGLNAPFVLNDLPNGPLRKKLLKISSKSQKQAITWMHKFSFNELDTQQMDVDSEGGVLFIDKFTLQSITSQTNTTSSIQTSMSATEVFKLHSKPNAPNVIYLDFNGHTISGTAWNIGTSANFNAPAFDTDGDITSYGQNELNQIAEIWHRVSEDYAPFDVDVTTEEPISFGPKVGRVLITQNKDVDGNAMPYSTVGGISYVGVWGRTNYHTKYSPAIVYYNNLASSPIYIAEAASHEMGHNLGLSHDGTSTSVYYSGLGSGFVSWSPIMGLSYNKNVTQWSKGEYSDANQTQDDLAILSKSLTYRNDDHGNDKYTPTFLVTTSKGEIQVTNPETDPFNYTPVNKGIIETNKDTDFFAVNVGTGPFNVLITPSWDAFYRDSGRGANLDIEATLYDWNGNLVAKSDLLDDTYAQLNLSVQEGKYLIGIKGVGNTKIPYSSYGSLGQYFISGSVTPYDEAKDNTPPSPNPMAWIIPPTAQSRTSISMTAIQAVDASGKVEYQFICSSSTSNCESSDWLTSPTYTANNLQPGTSYSFQVKARDANLNETQLSLTSSIVTPANKAPIVSNGSYTLNEDSSLTIDLSKLSNDPEQDNLTFTLTSSPLKGSLVDNGYGSIVYTPNPNYHGIDSFTFLVKDNFGASTSGKVILVINSVNDAPIAKANFTVSETNFLSVNFLSDGSTDPDTSDTLSYLWSFGDGTTSNTKNPIHVFSKPGTYTVSLKVSDNSGLSSTVTITITLTAPPLSTPTDLTGTLYRFSSSNKTSNYAYLRWTAVSKASSYNIWRCTEQNVDGQTICDFTSKPYYTTSSTSFFEYIGNAPTRYRISAVNQYTESTLSNEVILTP